MNYTLGSGLSLDWFNSDQQRHITAHRMDNIPTMTVQLHWSSHRNTVLNTTCLLRGAQPETAPHLWACSAQSHEWGPARRPLAEWLDQKVGRRAVSVRHQLWEPVVMEQWAAALRTPSMQRAHMECSGPHQSMVRPHQGASDVAESPPGPEQHDGAGVARAAPAPAGGERGSTAHGGAAGPGPCMRHPLPPPPLPPPPPGFER